LLTPPTLLSASQAGLIPLIKSLQFVAILLLFKLLREYFYSR
jgi:hypothetical protein